jgi:hypothetical protein
VREQGISEGKDFDKDLLVGERGFEPPPPCAYQARTSKRPEPAVREQGFYASKGLDKGLIGRGERI